MLRFFRNIRQKLLENRNVRKYFWYALGEILLVVIGILIALQINNWNEERKEALIEIQFMNQLLDDARQDSSFFNSRLVVLTQNNNDLQRLVYRSPAAWQDTIQLIAKDTSIAFFFRVVHDSFLMNNNPEPFEKVSDPALKETLRSYQNAHNYFSQATEVLNRVVEDYGMELEAKYHRNLNMIRNRETSQENDFDFLKNDDIQSRIQIFNTLHINAIDQLPLFLEHNTILIDQLTTRLN